MRGDIDGPAPTPIDPDVRSDALDVLQDAVQWRLAETRWAVIGSVVSRLAAAVCTGDGDRTRTAVAELELLGPVRATPVGRTPTVPPPDAVREEINELVHTLDGRSEPSP
ncbi:CATRA system-associated protein [Pseudonocardia charpentierae]|uniref:CATRA-Associated Small Protein domain-containing protein n=1 Tax=Pseudonocardia charpentierae TaxID=3075545 RepID=A0ABU2NK84_9PSEU|nr:CATRA system-associated protein [Pseudonocardia sp. DSM 45834]MDT0353624.1 hypothetical protein [Pseudonocardia sp. DSM 45834]